MRARTTPPHPAAASRCGESFRAQLDLFGAPTSGDPLLGLAVSKTCRKCGDLVAILGPGKGPHSASLLCRSCGLHHSWVSRANYTLAKELTTKFGPPREPIVFPRRRRN
jgi:hypothetical protein